MAAPHAASLVCRRTPGGDAIDPEAHHRESACRRRDGGSAGAGACRRVPSEVTPGAATPCQTRWQRARSDSTHGLVPAVHQQGPLVGGAVVHLEGSLQVPERGYAAKFRRLADPGGRAPLGFRRIPPVFVLAVDPDTIDVAVRIFERYAAGTLSIEEVANEFGLNDRRVTEMLKNPIYNGWVARKREWTPAPWRATPPISDELWERVAALRASRARHAGSPRLVRVDLLRGLLYCVCGQRIRTDGTMGTPPRQRKLHPRHDQCLEWGPKASHSSGVYEPWIIGQVTGIRVDETTVERIVRVLSTPPAHPVDVNRARLDRMKRELALDHAAGLIDDRAYLAQIAVLREEAMKIDAGERSGNAIAPDKVVA